MGIRSRHTTFTYDNLNRRTRIDYPIYTQPVSGGAGPDAVQCLDLLLDDVGVDCHDLRVRRGGARVIIDLVDRIDGCRLVDALRQHLCAELHESTIYGDGYRTRILSQVPVPKLAAPWVAHRQSLLR